MVFIRRCRGGFRVVFRGGRWTVSGSKASFFILVARFRRFFVNSNNDNKDVIRVGEYFLGVRTV